MGHVRLGRLPKTRRWQEVVSFLATEEVLPAGVAAATLRAAESHLGALKGDPALKAAVEVLVRLASAGRAKEFTAALEQAGIKVPEGVKGPALYALLRQASRGALLAAAQSSPATHIAADALDGALSRLLRSSSGDLFETGIQDLHAACRDLSKKSVFSDVTHDFFSDYLTRWLSFFLDKASPGLVGSSSRFPSTDRLRSFQGAMSLHAKQSARVVAEFSGSWFSKHNFESGGQINRRDIAGFVAHALTKLVMELHQQAAP
jgi:hypothetical protein